MSLLPGSAPVVVPRPLPAWVEAAQEAAAAPPKPKIRTGQHRRAPFADHRRAASQVGEHVTSAWFSARGGSDIGIPIGIVGALAMMAPADEHGPDLGDQVLALNPAELTDLLRHIWRSYWLRRPDLIERALPLHDWLNHGEADSDLLYAAHKTAHAAINSGLLDITGHKDPSLRSDADVLSRLVMEMRSKAQRSGSGEFHTPNAVCDFMARILLGSPEDLRPGLSIHDPAAGSGSMLRAAAQHIRDAGHQPADFHWFANDIDPIAVACCAVNAIVWDLGPNVVIAKADSLAEPNWPSRARAERAEIIAHRNRTVERAATEAAWRRAARLLDTLTQPLERTA
ncbi:hypothetical protein GCM10010193_56940 [Kitasatospora atroaurantiaca]|uniref:site-specific DNA-methyltransferase (adenine-specific) n=1 Tax=Kitasatospora atroaurantiaca TaxID=285545 RepID=A0A561EMU3_9ACTN|nr:N-6 DNA methylase [Kitasatospora atroaurantiaca]TWE16943.1 N-6 DNA methylase [Kitasatospora atroaurantiaca]